VGIKYARRGVWCGDMVCGVYGYGVWIKENGMVIYHADMLGGDYMDSLIKPFRCPVTRIGTTVVIPVDDGHAACLIAGLGITT